MTDLEQETDFAKLLEPIILEAKQLRFDSEIDKRDPGLDAAPQEERAYIQFIRQKMNRLEYLLFAAIRLKAQAVRSHKDAVRLADDAWDAESVKTRQSPVRRGPSGYDGTGPRERYADYNTATLPQRREVREAERVLSIANEAMDCVKSCHEGLNAIRQEHLSILRTIQFESSLEREH